MADFYWSGLRTGVTSGTGGAGVGVTGYQWHNKDNWFIKVLGTTSGYTQGASGGLGFYFEGATRAPRGRDSVYFTLLPDAEDIGLAGGPWPKTPCLYGGFCGGFPAGISYGSALGNSAQAGWPNPGGNTGMWEGTSGDEADMHGNLSELVITESYGGIFGYEKGSGFQANDTSAQEVQMPAESFSWPLGGYTVVAPFGKAKGSVVNKFMSNGYFATDGPSAEQYHQGPKQTQSNGTSGPGFIPKLVIKADSVFDSSRNAVTLWDSYVRNYYCVGTSRVAFYNGNVEVWTDERSFFGPNGSSVHATRNRGPAINEGPQMNTTNFIGSGVGQVFKVLGRTGPHNLTVQASGDIPHFIYAPRVRNAQDTDRSGDGHVARHKVSGNIDKLDVYPQSSHLQDWLDFPSYGLGRRYPDFTFGARGVFVNGNYPLELGSQLSFINWNRSDLHNDERVNRHGPYTVDELTLHDYNPYYDVEIGDTGGQVYPSNREEPPFLPNDFISRAGWWTNHFKFGAGATVNDFKIDGGVSTIATDAFAGATREYQEAVSVLDGHITGKGRLFGFKPDDLQWQGFQLGASISANNPEEGMEILDKEARIYPAPGHYIMTQYVDGQGGNSASERMASLSFRTGKVTPEDITGKGKI